MGARVGYFQGDPRKLVDDIGALQPTFFIGALPVAPGRLSARCGPDAWCACAGASCRAAQPRPDAGWLSAQRPTSGIAAGF